MKELLKEIQELAISGDESLSLLKALLELSYLMDSTNSREVNEKYFNDIRMGLSGAIKFLDSSVVTKLYEMDNYTSIKAEEHKPTFKAS